MFSNEPALEWLEKNRDAAMSAETWDAFCASQGPLGDHYRTYAWLSKRWEFLKERGYLTWHTVQYPKVRKFSELFTEARLCPSKYRETNKAGRQGLGTYVEHPPGFIGLHGTASIAGNFGGTRGWSERFPKGEVRSHYGATFYHTYVKLRDGLVLEETICGISSLEAIRQTGGTILIKSNDRHCIGGNWVAILDAGESIEPLLVPEDREMLARERQADLDAWGPDTDKDAV
jgi:hypothetical protein